MQSINRMGSRALGARWFATPWAVLVMGPGALAWPATTLAWTGQPLAYVANFASNSISVVDTGDNTVVDTIGVGNGPEGIAVAPDGKHVYVTVSTDNDLSVIDTTTNKVVGTPIPVGTLPVNVAVTPDGKRAFVANFGSFNLNGSQNGSVSVIDTAKNAVVATIMVPLSSFGHAFGVAITPDGKYAYVTVEQFVADSEGAVLVIDTSKNTLVAAVPKPQSVWIDPQGVAITPDGKYAYVAGTATFR